MYLCDLWIKRSRDAHSLKTLKWSFEVTFDDALFEFSPSPFALRLIAHEKRIVDVENF